MTQPAKQITGYCEPWSLRAGETVTLRASSHRPGPAALELVQLHCGDPTRSGPGFAETTVPSALPTTVELADQPINPGSWGELPVGLAAERTARFSCTLRATRPVGTQVVVALSDIELVVNDGRLMIARGDQLQTIRQQPLDPRRWYHVDLTYHAATGLVDVELRTEQSVSPGRDVLEPGHHEASLATPAGSLTVDRVLLAPGGSFDGRLGALRVQIDELDLAWDLAQRMNTPIIVETTATQRDGRLHQLPTRAVTGAAWNATEQCWRLAPDHYDAVHFHHDDLYDAEWHATASLTLPADLPSGIYCFRLRQSGGDDDGDQFDRVPFFVRPALGAPTSNVALLMSTATYTAYANHHQLFQGADFIAARSNLRPEHEYVRQHHGRIGRSMYEKHPDGSGVMFSSRRRPVLNLRPGADGWNFTPDTDLNAWLDHTGIGHDIITDDALHTDGIDALAPYRVVVTCTHPEYWSTSMLDALDAWQRSGGRLLYLGGNGFYWRIAFSDEWPDAMELRRAEDGVRNWQTEDGESYHAWGGEYGGMWRRNGRPPQEMVGIGFAAQGFARATHYDVDEAVFDSRAAWILDGVELDNGRIGTSGLGGGAAGQEVDRYDTRLGSPAHAVVVASATDFGPDMVRTKEEFEGSVEYPSPDPFVRADIVFYETPSGGATFSVGSIAWFGSLARNGYDNDTARITTNVLRRFADPAPFDPPSAWVDDRPDGNDSAL